MSPIDLLLEELNELFRKVDSFFDEAFVKTRTRQIYTSDGTVKLKSVHRLEIANRTVTIHTKESSKIACTKKPENGTPAPFSVFGLNSIVPGHEKSLVRIMEENSNQNNILKTQVNRPVGE